MLSDVGWNDVGYNDSPSTWLDAATPRLNAIAASGIRLTRHYTGWVCGPTRAVLLTGRYPYRSGYGNMPEANVNLPLDESTMGQELQKLGYRTGLVGKWHLGLQLWDYTPTYRGFERFYGYYYGSIGYYRKEATNGYLDLHDQRDLVVAPPELSNKTHLTTLLHSKAEKFVFDHASLSPSIPLFLLYAPQNGAF